MVATKEAQSIRSDISNDILTFIRILENSFDTITSATNICQILEDKSDIPVYGMTPSNNNYWGYETNIRLPISIIGGLKPIATQPSMLEFSIKLIADSDKFKHESFDPLVYLEFNIVTIGYFNGKEMIHSLHLDRHPDSGTSDDPHPKYHFQFGGRKLEEKINDYGQGMFFDTPRIMHYPMDFILGMDFILSNYYSDIWIMIKESNHEYNSLVGKYQDIMIKPYFNSFTNHWSARTPFHDRDWNTQDVCPQITERPKS
ncbi:MAG: hypothetical protein DRG78_10040 [Epsilonproteobacteria bacterium]|nr:MAG: hypothetical protein DRG78_10040 [Campylobacterota bacterium]